MPTLSDFRRWLSGEIVNGFPRWPALGGERKAEDEGPAEEDPRKKKFKEKFEAARRKASAKYSLSLDGKDATLHFGKYSGTTIREIAKTRGGRSYLKWTTSQDFPEEIKKIIQEVLAS